MRALDRLESRQLLGTEDGYFPFWSPDSRWIGFSADGKLKKVEAAGGPPQNLADATIPVLGGTWLLEGQIAYGSIPGVGNLFRVPQAGGTPVEIAKPDPGRQEAALQFPQLLPDGRHLIFQGYTPQSETRAIYLSRLDLKQRKRLAFSAQDGVYAPPATRDQPGYLLFLRESTLMAQPLDPRTYDVAGDALAVAEQVGAYRSYGFFSASRNGVLVYRNGSAASIGSQRLDWFDREGRPVGGVGAPGVYDDVALSPDGKRVAASELDSRNGNWDIWLLDIARGVPTRFTFNPAIDLFPVWSPDGKRVLFATTRDGPFSIYQKDSGGARNDQPLLKSALPKHPYDISPDGRYLLYMAKGPATKNSLWILPLDANGAANGQPAPYLQSQFNETQGQFAPVPTGGTRWVAYTSDESGHDEIYVQSFPAGAGKFQVSKGGGVQPRWRADGKELFYIAPDGKLMAAEVKTVPQFEAGIPQALFPSHMLMAGAPSPALFRYAPSRDGKRFLIVTEPAADQKASEPLTVVLNWTAGLKK